MANPNMEDYENSIGKNSFKKTLDYEELLERAKEKRDTYERTKSWITEETSIKEYIQVPQSELALAEYYGKIPEVELDPNIQEFWQTQKDELSKIDMQGPQNDYLKAFERWQELVEDLDDRKRDALGANNFDYKELKAKEGVQKAQEHVKDAKEDIKQMQNDISPFQVMLSAFTGMTKDKRTVRDTYRRLRDAKRSLRDAKINLRSVRESRAAFEQANSKLNVKEKMCLEEMLIAQEKIAINKQTAERINANALQVQKSLHEQYALVDKYISIQTFKKSNDYVAVREAIRETNPDFLKEIDAFPETVPSNFLKVTLQGPLQLPSNESKITELSAKIEKMKSKLPFEIDMENLSTESKNLEIKPTDTIESIEEAMSKKTPESKEYKQLQMKWDHLVLVDQIETLKEEIKTLVNEIKSTSDDKALQAKLQTLQAKQGKMKILEEAIQKDPYSQTMSTLQEMDKLTSEKEALSSQDNIATLESTAQELEDSNISFDKPDGSSITIVIAYKAILESIERRKQQYLVKAARDNERASSESGRDR